MLSVSVRCSESRWTPGRQDCDLQGFLRQLKQEAPLIFRVGFYLSAWVLVLTPILTVFRPLPAFLLSKSKLDAHVMNLSQSRFYGLRQSLLMVRISGWDVLGCQIQTFVSALRARTLW